MAASPHSGGSSANFDPDSVSAEELVRYLLAAKNSLFSIPSVQRGNDLATQAFKLQEDSVIVAAQTGFVRDGLLEQVKTITPGKRAPTVSPLEGSDWCAISSMVEKSRIAVVMDQLTEHGAHDILVIPISNTRA